MQWVLQRPMAIVLGLVKTHSSCRWFVTTFFFFNFLLRVFLSFGGHCKFLVVWGHTNAIFSLDWTLQIEC
jgi:hypothetical protein